MSCPDCTHGGLLPGEPTGSIGIQGSYVAAATIQGNENKTQRRAIVLLTDAFGLPLKNCKIIADDLAKRLACDVWVPDIFAGRPLLSLDHLVPSERPGQHMGIFSWLKFAFVFISRLSIFYRSRASVVDARLFDFFKMLQESKYDKIGAVGYCIGGSTAIRLGSTDMVQSIVVCHPGPFSMAQVQAIKVPSAWVCAEEDMYFSKAKQMECEAVFSRKKGSDGFIDYEFQEYKGTTHGFAIRPDYALPEMKEAYEKALDQIVEWFSKTLPM